ncbi:ACP S-malonyltransferase [Candidatus Tachikawaea gelatinosa]|uniref:Malonyl CoA-acyl carrier protein transacylase n=1 Tax=Candidatus Tachikawaea gelatinosa TaxID=1410383 RepID=A0A090BWL3_9ENTR|nr:ACP S-malonyltransferase [Candidatus Tachikawaea gelatinosa]BAP58806.1 malonyl CoA-acyl carrier protein transacylase [Candidatus Tachikawaea gelatinosa]
MKSFGMVFPGQGSQHIGMLSQLISKYPEVQETFDEASSILDNKDLWQLVQNGPREELNKTINTQPALLSASVAIFKILKKKKIIPQIMAGHSLGEYSALVCAKVLSFHNAIKLIKIRSELMENAVPKGTGLMMAIIGLEKKIVQKLCLENKKKQEIVEISNFNSPYQIVISGNKESVKKTGIACKNIGAKHIVQLPISIPSHCSLMKPIAKKFSQYLKKVDFYPPKIPVINNVDVTIENDVNIIRKNLARQLYKPVRWIEIVQFITKKNIEKILEIGPKKVLNKLIVSITNSIETISINDYKSLSLVYKFIKE